MTLYGHILNKTFSIIHLLTDKKSFLAGTSIFWQKRQSHFFAPGRPLHSLFQTRSRIIIPQQLSKNRHVDMNRPKITLNRQQNNDSNSPCPSIFCRSQIYASKRYNSSQPHNCAARKPHSGRDHTASGKPLPQSLMNEHQRTGRKHIRNPADTDILPYS